MTPLVFALLQDAEPAPQQPPPPPVVQQAPPPVVQQAPPPEPEPAPPQEEEKMSEGRMLVHLRETGFQWGISPGVVFVNGEAGFALGLYAGYGFDLGSIIVVPGLRLSGYFTDPSVYIGMPNVKVAFPIDRFEPFVEGGAGVGHVTDPSKTGAALYGGGGFLIHFRPIAFGAAVSYTAILGTSFRGIGVGPLLAIGF